MKSDYRFFTLIRPRRGRQTGFSLVELVVVMMIAALLAAIAVPMYLNQVRESRRTDARSALLDLAGREERYYATNNAYTNSALNLGYGNNAWPITVGSGYYQITVSVPAVAPDPNPPGAPSYSVTAVPISTQVKDTTCASLTVDSGGQQTALDTSNNTQSSACWGQ
jgi:type IV pilus assembly protein PilE